MDRHERAQWVPVLTAARKAWNLTQQQVADAAGISLKSMGNLERQGMVPQEGTLEKVREALSLPRELRAAEEVVEARVQHMYAEANQMANARIREARSGLSLAAFSSAQLLRELLTRAEDPQYAETLEREAEREHWIELNRALDEVGPHHNVTDISAGKGRPSVGPPTVTEQDLVGEPSVAQPRPVNDVEGDEEPEGP